MKTDKANRPLRVIISGGGTGGHIFPAISIANALRRRNPQTEILFVGALGRMRFKAFPLPDSTAVASGVTSAFLSSWPRVF